MFKYLKDDIKNKNIDQRTYQCSNQGYRALIANQIGEV